MPGGCQGVDCQAGGEGQLTEEPMKISARIDAAARAAAREAVEGGGGFIRFSITHEARTPSPSFTRSSPIILHSSILQDPQGGFALV